MDRKRNIHIVIDMSRSMWSIACCVYIFILDLLNNLEKDRECYYTYQVTWFAGKMEEPEKEDASTIIWNCGKNYTDDFYELMNRLKKLTFPCRRTTTEDSVRNAVKTALVENYGNPQDQILLLFSDMNLYGTFDFSGERAVRRVFLFLPGETAADFRFQFVNQDGDEQISFPVVQIPILGLTGENCPMDSAINYLKQMII